MSSGERVSSVGLFLYTRAHTDSPPNFSLTFVFLVPRRFTLTGECLCILALHGTYRVHDEG